MTFLIAGLVLGCGVDLSASGGGLLEFTVVLESNEARYAREVIDR